MDYDPQWDDDLERKQSGLGIASFIIAILVGLSAVALVVIAGMIEVSTPGGMDDQSPAAMIIGLGVFAIVGLCMLGIGLGVAGFFQPHRTRIFCVLGVAFNGLVILGLAGLIVVGLTVAA